MKLYREIHEQPGVLERLIAEQSENIQSIAKQLKQQEIFSVFLAARGSSDNAGLYAKYLMGSLNRLPISLAAPSLFSIYERPPRFKDCLVMGISQSGQSPDIVSVLQEGRRQGAPTLAITNDPCSPLAEASDFVIDLCAGEEKAVAATKTYTSQLLAIALLAVSLADDDEKLAALKTLPEKAKGILSQNDPIQRLAERYTYMEQCVVLGRGFNYASAYEWALKLKELTYVIAEPYSSADFQHGPIALLEHRFPVLAVIPEGAVSQDMLKLLKTMLKRYNTEMVMISNQDAALNLAHTPLRIPAGIPEWLSPVLCILPAQLFTYFLTLAKGYDPDKPRGLHKVTETW